MIGLYVNKRSPLHRLPAGWKLAGLVAVSAGTFALGTGRGLLLGCGLAIGLVLLAQIPLPLVWRQFRPLISLLLAIGLLQGWATDWAEAIVVLLRLVLLWLLAMLVSWTTPTSELLSAIESICQPLAKVGINPAQVSLSIALTLRLIPMLLEQFQAIREAQQARGLDRHFLALLVPFLVKTLRMADDLSDAIEARCYDASDPAEIETETEKAPNP